MSNRNRMIFQVRESDETLNEVAFPEDVSGNIKHLAVITYDVVNNEIGISIDGASIIKAPYTLEAAAVLEDFIVGSQGGDVNSARAAISHIGLWKDRVLTDLDATTLYNGGDAQCRDNLAASLEANLTSWYNMDEESDGSGAVPRVDSEGLNNLADPNQVPSAGVCPGLAEGIIVAGACYSRTGTVDAEITDTAFDCQIAGCSANCQCTGSCVGSEVCLRLNDDVLDSSGNANDGVNTGVTFVEDGFLEEAGFFDGSAFIDLPVLGIAAETDAVSAFAFFKSTDQTDYRSILANGADVKLGTTQASPDDIVLTSNFIGDRSASQHDLTFKNSPVLSNGRLLLDNGPYATSPASVDFELENHLTWTAEAIINLSILTGYSYILNGGNTGWEFQYGPNDGVIAFNQTNVGGGMSLSFVVTPTLNQDYHVAVTFDGVNYKLWWNGVEVDSSTAASGSPTTAAGDLLVGINGGLTDPFKGEMVCSISDTARYTAPFTPPVTLINDANTLLLIQGLGDIAEGGDAPHPMTMVGDPVISGTELVLNGSNKVTMPVTADYDFGTGDVTIEFIIDQTSHSDYGGILGGDYSTGWSIFWNFSTNQPRVINNQNAGPGYIDYTSTDSVPVGVPTHVALVRNGTELAWYIGGIKDASPAIIDAGVALDLPSILQIGFQVNNGSPYSTFNMDGVKIEKAALYTADFTPPTEFSPFGTVTYLQAEVGNLKVTSPVALIQGRCYSAAFTYDGVDTLELFLSAVSQGTDTQVVTPFITDDWVIGNGFIGILDEVRIFASVLTLPQIQGLHDQWDQLCASLEAYVDCSDSSIVATFASGLPATDKTWIRDENNQWVACEKSGTSNVNPTDPLNIISQDDVPAVCGDLIIPDFSDHFDGVALDQSRWTTVGLGGTGTVQSQSGGSNDWILGKVDASNQLSYLMDILPIFTQDFEFAIEFDGVFATPLNISDNFDGLAGNSGTVGDAFWLERWTQQLSEGVATIVSDKLRYTSDISDTTPQDLAYYIQDQAGDFVAEGTFEMVQYESSTTTSQFAQIRLETTGGGFLGLIQIGKAGSDGNDDWRIRASSGLNDQVTDAPSTARFRVSRVGTTVSYAYDIGAGFVTAPQTDTIAGTVRLIFRSTSYWLTDNLIVDISDMTLQDANGFNIPVTNASGTKSIGELVIEGAALELIIARRWDPSIGHHIYTKINASEVTVPVDASELTTGKLKITRVDNKWELSYTDGTDWIDVQISTNILTPIDSAELRAYDNTPVSATNTTGSFKEYEINRIPRIALQPSGFNNDACGIKFCDDLNDEQILLYPTSPNVWKAYYNGFVLRITNTPTKWLLEAYVGTITGLPCWSFSQVQSFVTTPNNSAWVWESGCGGTGAAIHLGFYYPPEDEDGEFSCGAVDPSCCDQMELTLSGVGGGVFCGGCACNEFNGVYTMTRDGNKWYGSALGHQAVIECISNVWYFRAQCPLGLNCVQFISAGACPPLFVGGWTIDPDFPGCNGQGTPVLEITGDLTSVKYIECYGVEPDIHISVLEDSIAGSPAVIHNGLFCYERDDFSCEPVDANGLTIVDDCENVICPESPFIDPSDWHFAFNPTTDNVRTGGSPPTEGSLVNEVFNLGSEGNAYDLTQNNAGCSWTAEGGGGLKFNRYTGFQLAGLILKNEGSNILKNSAAATILVVVKYYSEQGGAPHSNDISVTEGNGAGTQNIGWDPSTQEYVCSKPSVYTGLATDITTAGAVFNQKYVYAMHVSNDGVNTFDVFFDGVKITHGEVASGGNNGNGGVRLFFDSLDSNFGITSSRMILYDVYAHAGYKTDAEIIAATTSLMAKHGL